LIRGSVYVQPSQWVTDIWKSYDCCRDLQLRVLPFGVDTDLFRPVTEIGTIFPVVKKNIMVYFKRRKPQEIEFVENILKFYKVPYRVFVYGSYSEADYMEYLKRAKYGIWLDAHESQGFALEEALSMNVPLLVWNIRTMSQEYGSSYPDVAATTIAYWDESCGEVVYDWQDFMSIYSLFLNKLDSYTPREFVLKELSIEACERRFLDLVREVKGAECARPESGTVGDPLDPPKDPM